MSWIPTATLFAMMLGLGMTLRPEDFRRLAARPLPVALGLAGQLVLLPLLAFAIAAALGLSPALAVGLVLIAACPGGVTSNVLCWMARGEVALSISLTAASSVVAFLTVPALVHLALATFGGGSAAVALSPGETLVTLFVSTALPVGLGMGVLRLAPGWAERLHRPLVGGSGAVLLLLIVGLGVSTWGSEHDVAGLALRAGPAVALLIALAAGAGYAAARALGLPGATARTLALEIGVQNFNLSLVVAIGLLGDARYAGPALIYLPVMLALAAVLVVLGRRPNERAAATGLAGRESGLASPGRG